MLENRLWKVGQKLPSEYELANYFDVSRETLRSAIRLLEKEGKLLVKHGVGIFVIKPLTVIPSRLEILQSIGKMIKLAGLEEGEDKIIIKEEECAPDWADALRVPVGSPVKKMERFRYAEGEVIVCSINIIPHHIVGKAFEIEATNPSLFQLLEEKHGVVIARSDTELRVPSRSDPYVQHLQGDKAEDTPVLLMKQLHYDERNSEVLYSYDYMRNDVFRFWVRRERHLNGGGSA